jgi:hypothetical protein
MATDVFYQDTGWQSSSGPYINRQVPLGDLWPEGLGSEAGGGNKDVLEDGMHQAFACGAKGNRPHNPVGVSVSMNEDADLVQMNFAPGFLFKAYVANVLTYSNGSPATFSQSLAAFQPVYVDDSDSLDLFPRRIALPTITRNVAGFSMIKTSTLITMLAAQMRPPAYRFPWQTA